MGDGFAVRFLLPSLSDSEGRPIEVEHTQDDGDARKEGAPLALEASILPSGASSPSTVLSAPYKSRLSSLDFHRPFARGHADGGQDRRRGSIGGTVMHRREIIAGREVDGYATGCCPVVSHTLSRAYLNSEGKFVESRPTRSLAGGNPLSFRAEAETTSVLLSALSIEGMTEVPLTCLERRQGGTDGISASLQDFGKRF